MRKAVPVFVSLLIFFASASPAHAALITVTKSGDMHWDVLGAISIKQIASSDVGNAVSELLLKNDGQDVSMNVDSNGSNKTVDLNNYDKEIVEIEKNTAPEKVTILASGNNFLIRQRGIDAKTSYPIKISKGNNDITLETSSGERYLTVLPHEAVLQIVRANIIKDINRDGEIQIVELPEGELAYKIDGEKQFSIFKFFNVPVKISAYVSALTGNVLEVDQPTWSRILNFLLV